MENNQMWEIIKKKSLQNHKNKEKLESSETAEDLSKIVDDVLCFSIKDMINFASYYGSLDSPGEIEESKMKEHLTSWFNKTS